MGISEEEHKTTEGVMINWQEREIVNEWTGIVLRQCAGGDYV